MNTVSIMGRVANEIELRKTQASKSVVTVTVAVDNGWGGDNKRTDFFDVVAWNSTAEFISKYFKKGHMIAITGSLQTRQWEDKDGNKHKKVEIIAGRVYFCGGKQEPKNHDNRSSDDSFPQEDNGPDYENIEFMDGDADLPF